MADSFGLSFMPGAQDNGTVNARVPPPRNPVQEAVQMLSLRPPKVYGARAIAPAPLLTGSGGMGQPAAKGNVVAQALAMLAGLPPSMVLPDAPKAVAPTLTDTYAGWRDQERGLDRSPTSGGDSSDDGNQGQWGHITRGGTQPVTLQPAAPPAGYAPPPLRVTPYQETGEGPSQPTEPPQFRPPSVPVPAPDYNIGFGQGNYGHLEDINNPDTWLSPWERQHGPYGR